MRAQNQRREDLRTAEEALRQGKVRALEDDSSSAAVAAAEAAVAAATTAEWEGRVFRTADNGADPADRPDRQPLREQERVTNPVQLVALGATAILLLRCLTVLLGTDPMVGGGVVESVFNAIEPLPSTAADWYGGG